LTFAQPDLSDYLFTGAGDTGKNTFDDRDVRAGDAGRRAVPGAEDGIRPQLRWSVVDPGGVLDTGYTTRNCLPNRQPPPLTIVNGVAQTTGQPALLPKGP
jgi:hypothetical protein